MMTNTQLLAIAVKQIGNNGTKYRNYAHASGNYCNMFVYWLFNANGCASLLPLPKTNYYRTYCPDSIKWCRKNLAEIPPYLAQPCDIIYMDWEPNGVPNHIGIVREHVSTSSIKTIEGNTTGKKNGKTVSGIVAAKTRNTKYTNVFRPHFKGVYKIGTISVDSDMGYNTIANLQKVLGGITVDGILGKKTVMRIQAFCGGITQDGSWGPTTSKKLQGKLAKEGYYTGKIDGEFGPASVKGLQRWINAKIKTTAPTTKPTTSTKPTTKPATSAKLVSYRIDVDLTNQICTVYGVYSNKSTKALMSEFISSAKKGCTTPVGNWKISSSKGRKAKYRTCLMSSKKAYAEYACRFKGAKMMHTVPYKKRQTTGHVNKTEFNKLGTPASAGCVRMPWKLAHYIYERCPVGTPVRVFKGKAGAYPMGKPKKYTATTDIDPTYKK